MQRRHPWLQKNLRKQQRRRREGRGRARNEYHLPFPDSLLNSFCVPLLWLSPVTTITSPCLPPWRPSSSLMLSPDIIAVVRWCSLCTRNIDVHLIDPCLILLFRFPFFVPGCDNPLSASLFRVITRTDIHRDMLIQIWSAETQNRRDTKGRNGLEVCGRSRGLC